MTITVPTDGFSSCDDSTAEFQLQPFADHPSGATISFWVNPHAVDKDVVRVSGVPGTPAALIAWLKRNPDLVVSGPTTRTIGAGIEATSVDLEVADSAPSVAADLACPGSSQTDIRSAAGLRDPLLYLEFGGIFGDNTPSPGYGLRYGSSPGEPVRLYFASIGSGRTANTLVISVDAFRPSDFASLAAIAETIIHSLRLPAALPPAPR